MVSELFIGLMSGTSVDAIDAVLMDFSKSNTHIVASTSQPLDSALKNEINRVIVKRTWPQEIKELDMRFAQVSSQVVHNLLEKASVQADKIAATGSHGQTIWHDPNGALPISIQIGNAQHIANETRITTVSNFRQADINAGGQGAPLTCAYHELLFRNEQENCTVLNLGGIANITYLPAEHSSNIIGFDIGPANTLLDVWIKKHQDLDFDKNGAWAKSGAVNKDLLNLMLEDEYFKILPPKSTGREKFNLIWLQYMLGQYKNFITKKDVQATLVALTVETITDAINIWAPNTSRILLCGGGSYNSYVVCQLQAAFHKIPVKYTSTDDVNEKQIEAMAFAWLAKQTLEGKPGNIPSVTGARRKVPLGDIYSPK
jgi:anhydro-N-acetylmuramic acid kinase